MRFLFVGKNKDVDFSVVYSHFMLYNYLPQMQLLIFFLNGINSFFALLVAAISISIVSLSILVMIGFWCLRKKSKVSPSFYLWIFVSVFICIY